MKLRTLELRLREIAKAGEPGGVDEQGGPGIGYALSQRCERRLVPEVGNRQLGYSTGR
jgi:hypothetical protein